MRSDRPSSLHLAAIHALVGECRELGDDNLTWHMHLLSGLARLVGADISVGGELAGMSTGQPRGIGRDSTTDWGFEHGFDRRGWDHGLEMLVEDPTAIKLLPSYVKADGLRSGSALCCSDLIELPDWERSVEFNEIYRVIGVDHILMCFVPIPRQHDEVLGSFLFRSVGRRDFSERERCIMRTAYAAITPLVGGPLARYLAPSPLDLTPRQRDVLRCVLEGDSDKQIALRLQLSKHTVNHHMKYIYQHFGVTTRAELLARWVRRGWTGGRPDW